MKKNILIIPSGPDALFQDWGDYSNFNFDVGIINWNNSQLRNTEHATYVENIPGPKWRNVAEFVRRHDVSQYEYIWILDDDCLTTPNNIAATFDFCKENNLDLSQPALTLDSFASHMPTLLIQGAKMHITNTVEIMCPIFSQQAWLPCTEYFNKMPLGIGWGLEGQWTQALDCESGITKFGGKVAVIDAFPVKHTKPVTGGPDYARVGIDPNDDSRYFQKLGFGWSFKTIEVINRDPKDKNMITVVVPTMWRYAPFLDFLEYILRLDVVTEVIIINNDNTRTPVKPVLSHPKIKLVDFGENIFVNPAWNYGVRASKNDIVCILNDDLIFDIRLFYKMADFITPNVGVVGKSAGEVSLGQTPLTTGEIYVEPFVNQNCFGFGELMFIHKNNWQDIPPELKIGFGEVFIFEKLLYSGFQNYLITNLFQYHAGSMTMKEVPRDSAAQILNQERHAYELIKKGFNP